MVVLFRQQHINIIRDALPICVKRQGLEIKEFPKAPKKPEGWIVHYDCTRCWQPRKSANHVHALDHDMRDLMVKLALPIYPTCIELNLAE